MEDQTKLSLFKRLGGMPAARAAVNGLYRRLLEDERLAFFFEDTTMSILKLHQLRFFNVAFTEIPEDLDLASLLLKKHLRLFQDKGLNETHFDMVAGHLVAELVSLGVPQHLIDEAVSVVGPLRVVFEHGAKKYGKVKSKDGQGEALGVDVIQVEQETRCSGSADKPKTVVEHLGGTSGVKDIVEDFYVRITSDEALSLILEGLDPQIVKSQLLKFFLRTLSNKEGRSRYCPDKFIRGSGASASRDEHEAQFWDHIRSRLFDRMLGHFLDALWEACVSTELIEIASEAMKPALMNSLFASV